MLKLDAFFFFFLMRSSCFSKREVLKASRAQRLSVALSVARSSGPMALTARVSGHSLITATKFTQ